MTRSATLLILCVACAFSIAAQEPSPADGAFDAALDNIQKGIDRHVYVTVPPVSLQHPRDSFDLPANALVVARQTIGGAPMGFRSFVNYWFGSVIAEEMSQAYGNAGPAPRMIERLKVGSLAVVPLGEFEAGAFEYDWARLNEKYPEVRYVVRLSWPVLDRLGTYAVVRYELLGRDRPSTLAPDSGPWQAASFVKFEKQTNGSWKLVSATIGSIWK